jgi:hypothetical protein
MSGEKTASPMSSLGARCTVRKWTEADGEAGFVYNSWLNSWRTSRYAGVIQNHEYYDVTRSTIDGLIARGATVLLAELDGELLGFACGEVKDGKKVHHYTYVKDPFLRKGVEERLLAELPGTKPGWFTFAQTQFLKDKAWKHAPEIARRQKL